MNKKTAIIILLFLVLGAIGTVSYFFFFNTNNEDDGGNVNIAEQPTNNFFPNSEETDPQNQNQQNNSDGDFQKIPSLRQISNNPVSGFTIFNETSTSTNELINNTGEGNATTTEEIIDTETVYKFINRSNGNIFQTNSKTLDVDRLSNRTIPKIQESFFVNNGNNVIDRYLDNSNNINTVYTKLINSDSASSSEDLFVDLDSTNLPQNINSINENINGLILYALNNQNGTVGYIFDVETPEDQNFSFNTQLSQVIISWFKENTILIGTKSSDYSNGLLFEYNIDTQTRTKILEVGTGFNFLARKDSDHIVYSDNSSGESNTYYFNTRTRNEVDLNISTVPSEKCVWSNTINTMIYCAIPNNMSGLGYPNLWYQGQTSFNDTLYRIDTATGLKVEVSSLEGNFDIFKPQVSDNDEYITFINKKDLTLWSLDIK